VPSGPIETMLARLPNLMRHGGGEDFTAMAEADRRCALNKGYLTRTAPGSERQAAEAARLLRVVVRLEQIGDVIAQRVASRAKKKRDRSVAFSDEGWVEQSPAVSNGAARRIIWTGCVKAGSRAASRVLCTSTRITVSRKSIRCWLKSAIRCWKAKASFATTGCAATCGLQPEIAVRGALQIHLQRAIISANYLATQTVLQSIHAKPIRRYDPETRR
jgi:hypothetical protein